MIGPKVMRTDPVISESLDDLLVPGVMVERFSLNLGHRAKIG